MLFKLSVPALKDVIVIKIAAAVAQTSHFNSTTIYSNTLLLKDENVNVFNESINVFIDHCFAFPVMKDDETINLLRLKFNNCKMKMFKNQSMYNHYLAADYELINSRNLFTAESVLSDY